MVLGHYSTLNPKPWTPKSMPTFGVQVGALNPKSQPLVLSLPSCSWEADLLRQYFVKRSARERRAGSEGPKAVRVQGLGCRV